MSRQRSVPRQEIHALFQRHVTGSDQALYQLALADVYAVALAVDSSRTDRPMVVEPDQVSTIGKGGFEACETLVDARYLLPAGEAGWPAPVCSAGAG